MAETLTTFVGNGSNADFSFAFPYIARAHVKVSVNQIIQTEGVEYSYLTASSVRLVTAPPAGAVVKIYRDTPITDRMVSFQNGAVLTEEELNLAVVQLFYRLQEQQDYYQDLFERGLTRISTGTFATAAEMLDAAVQEVLADPLLAQLQARINDIDLNAQSVITNANQITNAYITIGTHDSRLDAVDLRFIPIEANQATYSNQIGTLQTDVSAQATQITTLTANIGTNSAAISSEQTARADADSALSTRIDVLQAFANTIYVQATAPTDTPPGTLVVGDLWYDSDDGNKPYRWDGLIWYSIRDGEFAVLAAQIVSEQTARTDGDSALAAVDASIQATRNLDYALIVANDTARIDGDSALTTSFNGLNTRMGTAESAITTEQTTRASADTALSTSVSNLTTSVNANAGAITAEATTRSNADGALSTTINSVSAVANAKNKSFRQITAPATGMTTGDLWFDSDDNNKAYRYDGATWVQTADTRIDANAAAVVSEATARADGDTAVAATVTALTTTVNANTSAITAEATARSDADTAEANARQALATTVGNNTSAITAEQTARSNAVSALATDISNLTTTVGNNTAAIAIEASSVDGLLAQYTVKVDVNGRVAGFGLASTAINGTPTSSFIVVADKFAIVDPANTAAAPKVPFVVTGGVVYMQNVVITDAAIQNLTVAKLTTGILTAGITQNADWNVGTGRVIFDNGSHLKAQGVGFGSANQFIEWFGVRPTAGNLALCTEANAISYLKTDGSAYFGGTLSAGVLFNTGTTSSLSTTAEIIVGPYGSNGGASIAVVHTYYGYRRITSPTQQVYADINMTVILERSLTGAAPWTAVATHPFTQPVSETYFFEPGLDPWKYTWNISQSWTYTDNLAVTTDRTYRFRISATNYSYTTQRLTITSTE